METLICLPFIVGVLWLLFNLSWLKKFDGRATEESFISVLIPLRNEEKNIAKLMQSLKNSEYGKVEFLLYDDDSTDQTAKLLMNEMRDDPRFHLMRGTALPKGWKGKPHACFELAKQAKGDILLWIDADVTLAETTLSQLSNTLEQRQLHAITGFPRFINHSFLEKLLTPLLHFFVHMHLPIALANHTAYVSATAASGAFIAIRRDAYFAIGGHEAVKNKVIEDVTLFKEIKRAGYRTSLLHIADYVNCTMYETTLETWRGFEKNCFKAFKESYSKALIVVFIYFLYYVLPLPLAIWGIFDKQLVYMIPLLCITIQRLISDYFARQLSLYSLCMPVSACAYCLLLCITMLRKRRNRKTLWKGREV